MREGVRNEVRFKQEGRCKFSSRSVRHEERYNVAGAGMRNEGR